MLVSAVPLLALTTGRRRMALDLVKVTRTTQKMTMVGEIAVFISIVYDDSI